MPSCERRADIAPRGNCRPMPSAHESNWSVDYRASRRKNKNNRFVGMTNQFCWNDRAHSAKSLI